MHRLIIVDDEKAIRNGLANYFPWDQVGFEVVATFGDGVDALDYVRSHPVDVVFCDIRMKRMSGITLAERLRQEAAHVSVVFLSAYRDFDYAQQAIRLGVRWYVVKPTRHDELFHIFGELGKALDSPEATEPVSRSSPEEIIDSVRRYSECHLGNATLEYAADKVGMNAHYFSRMFKEQSGETYSSFITRLRMEKAAQLLRSTGQPTYEIAGKVGYGSPKSFARRFRLHFGMTPSAYRRSTHSLPR